MPLAKADLDFIRDQFPQIEGWCLEDAAYLTCCLLNAQTAAARDSAILEIGVFKGKYLSVLYQKALRSSQRVVGIDTFGWSSPTDVVESFTRVLGSSAGLYLHTLDSSKLTAHELISLLGGTKASFISVDGDHTPPGVAADLRLTSEVLAEGGIVAIDDFLNPRAIGVSEGAYRFFLGSDSPALRPFAHGANKLFVADLKYHEYYRESIVSFVAEMPDLPMAQEFERNRKLGPHWVDQDLLGCKVLIL
jgi:hypothetical protein